MVKERTEKISQTTIISMGWTKSMIDKLLPEPTLKPNPHYKCAAPMKLWEKSLVNAAFFSGFQKHILNTLMNVQDRQRN